LVEYLSKLYGVGLRLLLLNVMYDFDDFLSPFTLGGGPSECGELRVGVAIGIKLRVTQCDTTSLGSA
jgi:hypothetical protein